MHRARPQRFVRGLARGLLGPFDPAAADRRPTARSGNGWAKNYLRGLIVRQANQFLTATLEIGALEGSLCAGVELRDVRLSRGSEASSRSITSRSRTAFASCSLTGHIRQIRSSARG